MSFSMQNFQMVNAKEGKQSHYSISVGTIGKLILGQHSSACTAKAYGKALVKGYLKLQTFLCSNELFISTLFFDVRSMSWEIEVI